jgi:hypothetical protein
MHRRRPALLVGAALAGLLVAALGRATAGPYRLPDAEMMSGQFAQLPGYSGSSSTLDGRLDVPGPGVEFQITLRGPDNGKLGLGEPDWPLDPAAGLDPDPGVPGECQAHANSSLANYTLYEMWVTYIEGPAGSDIDIGLILNTGLTGPSGFPVSDPTNDTFWGGSWVTVPLGGTAHLVLDFASAQAYNITNNKVPHTGGGQGLPDGAQYTINDRDLHEISNIGLQIADFNGDALGSQIRVQLTVVPEPASTAFLLLAGAIACRRRARDKLTRKARS